MGLRIYTSTLLLGGIIGIGVWGVGYTQTTVDASQPPLNGVWESDCFRDNEHGKLSTYRTLKLVFSPYDVERIDTLFLDSSCAEKAVSVNITGDFKSHSSFFSADNDRLDILVRSRKIVFDQKNADRLNSVLWMDASASVQPGMTISSDYALWQSMERLYVGRFKTDHEVASVASHPSDTQWVQRMTKRR